MRTERLILRPLQAGDLPAFVAYRQDPNVARYQSWEPTYSLADAERLLAHPGAFGQAGSGVQTALVERRCGTLVGDCFSHVLSGSTRTAEIGVTLAAVHQGAGFATEALPALITALFDAAEIDRVIAQADERNTRIHRLLERLGFRLATRLVDEEQTLRVYAVRREEWVADFPARHT